MEWPNGCSYWKRKDVRALISKHRLKPVTFHGCALGLASIVKATLGLPIKKPWRILTNCDEIVEVFVDKICPGCEEHVTCRGIDANNSENYTPLYVASRHEACERANRRVSN
jgi:hypothetical protein